MRASTPGVRSLMSAAAVLGTAAAVAGCGGSSKSAAQASTKQPSAKVPAGTILRAADVSSAAQGYKLVMTLHEIVGTTVVDATADGSFSPAAHQGDITMSVNLPSAGASKTLQLETVLDQDTIYIKLPSSLANEIPGGKPWISADLTQIGKLAGIPGYGSLLDSSSSFNNPGEYLDFLRATADGTVKDLGQETINGVQTTHYQAEVDFAKLPDAVPAADRQAATQLVTELQKKAQIPEFPIDVWIDSLHLVRRVQMTLNENVAGKSLAAGITENFIAYGPQPAPSIPAADQTVNLLSLIHSS